MFHENESPLGATVSECISELEFISTIPKNHKPCYNSKTTISTSGWFVTLKRRWNNEKGEEGVLYVKKLLDSCDDIYHMCYEVESDDIQDLTNALGSSVLGFDNLIDTYSDQPKVKDDYIECKNKVLSILENIKSKGKLVKVEIPNTKPSFFGTINSTFIIPK